MTEPRTKAGRALLIAAEDWDIVDYDSDPKGHALENHRAVLADYAIAIEAEAAALDVERLAKFLYERYRPANATYNDGWLADARAILDAEDER